jgi:hypothetical protein
VVGLRLGTYLLWDGYIGLFVIGAAFLRLYYLGSREGSYLELAVYPLYAFFMFFLLYPIEVSLSAPRTPGGSPGFGAGPKGAETIRIPRALAYVCALTDALQQSLIHDLAGSVGGTMREWERLAALNEKTRLMDLQSRRKLGIYLKYCYWPTLAQPGAPDGQPWDQVPLADLPIDPWLAGRYQEIGLSAPIDAQVVPCAALQEQLRADLGRELSTEPFHQQALLAFQEAGVDPGQARIFYRRRILYNEVFVVAGVEGAAIREALPEYSLLKGWGWDPTYMATDIKEKSGFWDVLGSLFGNLPTVAISLTSAIGEWWSQKAMGPGIYYRVSALAPHLYGLVIAILFMLFRMAGVMAFWPKWWSAVVNFMKLFLSVKLWPILWAFLSAILSSRNVFDGTRPDGFQSGMGTSGVFPAICSMYLVVPMLSFMMINLAHHAAGTMLGAMLGASEGASLGEGRGLLGAVLGGSGAIRQLAERAFNPARRRQERSQDVE